MTLILNGTDNSATTPAVTGTDTDTGVFFPTSDTVGISTAATERLRISSAGNLTVGKTDITTSVDGFAVLSSGETRISCSANDVLNLNRNTSNGAIQRFFRSGSLVGLIEGATTGLTYTGINGLTFTATQTASADANTLDDYEEGTYTFTCTPTSGSITLDTKTGTYTKVGRLVTITGFANVLSVSSPSGTSVNFNLPFTAASLTGQAGRSGGAVTYYNGTTQTNAPFYVLSGNATLTITLNAALVATNHDWSFGFSFITAT